jgi:hypothetical protein
MEAMKIALFASMTLFLTAGLVLAQEPSVPFSGPQAPVASSLMSQPDGVDPSESSPLAEPAPTQTIWFSAEYLLWWTSAAPNPVPLVTTFPAGTAALPGFALPGAIGGPGTQFVFGGESIDTGDRSGGRFTLGGWLNPQQTVGLEGSYFFIARRAVTQTVSSDAGGSPFLGMPFFDAGSATEKVFNIASPGTVAGGAVLTVTSQLQGADLNALVKVPKNDPWRLDALVGVRYLNLSERLTFAQNGAGLPGSRNAGVVSSAVDDFTTHNNFYGGQIGARGEARLGILFLSATAKVALGDMNEVVRISGSTLANESGGVLVPTAQTTVGGFFTQRSNIGRYSRDEVCVVPEVDISPGVQLAQWARLFVGYTFLYASDVARPGTQIDHQINLSQQAAFRPGGILVGPARPAFSFSGSDYWAQGLNFGLQLRY